jgi:hypothetical protein
MSNNNTDKKECANMEISPKEVSNFIDEVNKFTNQIIETHCKTCKEYKYGNNYECFCTTVLEMLDAHTKPMKEPSGYEDFICKAWNHKQKQQAISNYKV